MLNSEWEDKCRWASSVVKVFHRNVHPVIGSGRRQMLSIDHSSKLDSRNRTCAVSMSVPIDSRGHQAERYVRRKTVSTRKRQSIRLQDGMMKGYTRNSRDQSSVIRFAQTQLRVSIRPQRECSSLSPIVKLKSLILQVQWSVCGA
ncbi:hypothetical protein M404DRAFT_858606 [Pisolithus tinctorius Marx 270]|uniref:Uncharacterized protein n=1 Tax=Pisolithus tinctorius Marx 270 TaxID=870435 RepID=A0A0C3NRK7_PISTI|nr:hypothetical protein M404DRAFT_858606 [Pisolithus tinctorius Marx 270]